MKNMILIIAGVSTVIAVVAAMVYRRHNIVL